MSEVRERRRPEPPPKRGKPSVFSADRVAQDDLPPDQRRRGRVQDFDQAVVRDLAEAMYRLQLGDGDTRSMIKQDGDEGQKLRDRAQINDPFARTFLTVLRGWGIEVPIDANPTRRAVP